MLNFLKKKKTVASVAATIDKIHNEFDSASEKLLKEAREIIAKNKSASKGDRLKALGFTIASPVQQSEENKKKEELAKLIEYYSVYYPNNKFITEEMVKAICEKYGLMFGDVSYYKGDVPEKNVKEMEAFVLRDEDKEKTSNLDDYYRRQQMQLQAQFLGAQNNIMGRFSIRGLGSAPTPYDGPPTQIVERVIKPSFKICAPEKDFDTRYLTVRDGYKLEYDPIVLQPVKGGMLLVTKWGMPESEDELIVNEKMN